MRPNILAMIIPLQSEKEDLREMTVFFKFA